jgi:glutamate 5-kinase
MTTMTRPLGTLKRGAPPISSLRLENARRIVVKIGSALLVDGTSGLMRRQWLETVADDIAKARARGQEVVVVSSGAIALGRRDLGLAPGPLRLEEAQAAAATGQIRLAHAYMEILAQHHIKVAQILLTLDDSEDRRRFLNARATLETLLKWGAVPVINENDTVATAEIRFGDNDRLAARVAQMIGADCLVLLSDIDGLYTANPQLDPDAEFLPQVHEITPEIEAMASGSGSDMGRGGMVTKIMAAKIATAAGCAMVIASGHKPHPLTAIVDGGRHTWFAASASPRAARKQWIAGLLDTQGAVIIDDGAKAALARGKSLLPAGVTALEGTFMRGDAIQVKDQTGRVLGRGISAYDLVDARRLLGVKSQEIEAILGFRGRDEIIHRDDLAIDAMNTESA